MRVVCAWCGKHIGGEADFEGELVSHGICPRCEAQTAIELKKPLTDEAGEHRPEAPEA